MLVTWTKESLHNLEKYYVAVNFEGKSHDLQMLVIREEGSISHGLDWFKALGIDLTGLYCVRKGNDSKFATFPGVFGESFLALPHDSSP